MAQEMIMPGAELLKDLREQIAALSEGKSMSVKAGHLSLGADLWLSADPAGQAEMSCAPAGEGFSLSLERGDSGAWAALGMRLPLEALRQARFLGLLVRLRSGGILSFTPTLRYYLSAGRIDAPTSAPVILAGGPREHLSYIPIDPVHLERARGAELNLFFHTDSVAAEFAGIEPLLIC